MKVEYNIVTQKFSFDENMTPDDYVLYFQQIVSGNYLLGFLRQVEEKFRGTETLNKINQAKLDYIKQLNETLTPPKQPVINGEVGWNNLRTT